MLLFFVGSFAFYQAWDFVLHQLIPSVNSALELVSMSHSLVGVHLWMGGTWITPSVNDSFNVTFICRSSFKDGRNMDNSISEQCLGEQVSFNVTFTCRSSFMDGRNMEGFFYCSEL